MLQITFSDFNIKDINPAYFIVSGVVTLIFVISLWIVYKKAGKHGWASIVPIYDIYTLLEIGGEKGSKVFWILLPVIGWIILLVAEIKAYIEMSRRFGKGAGFGILLIFFPFIGLPILAFSSAEYEKPAEEKSISILDVEADGVPTDQDFDYGYEKQDTLVMNPVDEEEKK